MRMQERGIGNLPFIAVLVLLIVAGAMFFVAQDKADSALEDIKRLKQLNTANGQTIIAAREAYDAWVDVFGFDIAAAKRDGDKYPSADDIKTSVRTALMKRAGEITKASEANLKARKYTVGATKEVKVIKGETTQIILYHTTFTDQIVTVQAMLAPLDAQFRFAAKLMEENNSQFEQASSAYDTRVKENSDKIDTISKKYATDVGEKQSANDQLKNDLDQVRDQVNNLQAQNDTLQSGSATVKAEAEKKVSTRDRQIRALSDRIKNLKEEKEIALKEDPTDGQVLVANSRKGVVYLNRGRRHKLSAGTKFKVWRAGKGNVRENIAVVLVTKVDRTSAEARIIKQIMRRVPVTAGMNISNPFYDPYAPMKVYVYGDLKHYPTEVARKRLAASGVTVATKLDDTVTIIVLGEPPVTASEDSGDEDEGEAAVAERRASMERDKRLTEILNRAKSIGALVVTEDVLRTFIDY